MSGPRKDWHVDPFGPAAPAPDTARLGRLLAQGVEHVNRLLEENRQLKEELQASKDQLEGYRSALAKLVMDYAHKTRGPQA